MVKLSLCKPIVRVQHFICRIKSRQSQSQLLLDYDEKNFVRTLFLQFMFL